MKPRAPSIYELRHKGVHVRLTVGPQTMTGEARAGQFMRPVTVRASHLGLLGPGTGCPHESAFATCLVEEVVCKALGLTRRSAFDLLLDDMYREIRHSEQPMRNATVLLLKPSHHQRKPGTNV